MFEYLPPRVRLRGKPLLPQREAERLRTDFERFGEGLPRPLEGYVLETFGVDLTSVYGGLPIKNPFGKASGQLSLAAHQVRKDAAAGLGFVVLKTVIAQDQFGGQTMREWAIPETHMAVERIRGRSGDQGWNVTWKGRGWFDTFESYCRLFETAIDQAAPFAMQVAPSVKYHLPTPSENFWKTDEYTFTTRALLEVWSKHHNSDPMPLEKDFSPTLAGSERAAQQAKILEWLRTVPGLIHCAAPGKVSVGLKIFNALFEDRFQLQMLEAVHSAPEGVNRADYLVYANRLFDPAREFEGKMGVAYGGPDLSNRNLAGFEQFLNLHVRRADPGAYQTTRLLPISATGDIHSGKIAADYLLRGASSFQMHTLFQVPDSEFTMRTGTKTEKVLHHLLFHPDTGFLAWILDIRERFDLPKGSNVLQVATWCSDNWDLVAQTFGLAQAG